MASSRRDSVSRACLLAGSKNVHSKSALQHELELLDKEKNHLLQSLRHEAKQFKQQFPTRSTSPGTRPSTATKDKLRSESPRPSAISRGASKSPRASARPSHETPSSATGSRSPRPPPKSVSLHSEHVVATHMASAQTADQASGDNGGSVPQIVVSDAADQQRGKQPAGSAPKRRGSIQRASSPFTATSGSGSESERSSPLSLSLPSYRARSDSNPAPRRLSHCPAPSTPSTDLRVPENPRGRSNSFSGIQPVRRRGSIHEQWGSISERNRPAMGSFKGRRGSVDMENLLRDLSFGVHHNELMAPEDPGPSFSDKQWEELKKCRYLRIPSRDNSVEDISEDGE